MKNDLLATKVGCLILKTHFLVIIKWTSLVQAKHFKAVKNVYKIDAFLYHGTIGWGVAQDVLLVANWLKISFWIQKWFHGIILKKICILQIWETQVLHCGGWK